ncbi:MAG: hypothetical protein JXQ87_04575 [Bacteroidia bacterium]
MLKPFFTLLLFVCLMFGSCQKCADCALIANDGIKTDTTYNEYCGSVLDDIEETSSYSKNGVTYKWNCE